MGARDLYIDEAHTALDIFRFAAFLKQIFLEFILTLYSKIDIIKWKRYPCLKICDKNEKNNLHDEGATGISSLTQQYAGSSQMWLSLAIFFRLWSVEQSYY